MSELLVREYTDARLASYQDIDLPGSRGRVTASATLQISDVKWECVTIIPDTLHNRAKFLQVKRVKVFEKGAKGWTEIPKSYLDGFFETTVSAPAKTIEESEELVISSIEDVLKMSVPNQLKAVTELSKSKDVEATDFLKELIKSPTLSDKARKLAEDYIGARR